MAAGSLSAIVTLSYSVSYGALIFSGPALQPFVPVGLRAALMAAWIVALVVALGSSFKFAIAGPDSNATAILAVMAAEIATSMLPLSENKLRPDIAASVVVMLTLSAVLTGLCVSALGLMGGGRLIRFLPYSVLGGFLAGTGYLVVTGAFKVLTGQQLIWTQLWALPPVHPLAWSVTLLVAVALLVFPKFVKHYLLMPAVIIVGVIVFYGGMSLVGMDVDMARDKGLLFPAMVETSLTGPDVAHVPSITAFSAFGLARWSFIFDQWPKFIAMTIVVMITILLNMTGLDLATQSDVHVDRELRVNGLANILSGICGGMIGYLSISRSMLNFRAGARSRMAGICTAVLCCGAAFLFAPLVTYVPRPVLAGLLFYLGLSMIREWIWDMFFKLPFTEYALVVTILLQIAVQGLMPGIAFGLLVAGVIFVYNYSRTNCVKNNFSGASFFSNKERPIAQMTELREKGKLARALTLQGYIFFGTSSAIGGTSRDLIEREKLKYLLLDFRMVQGLDASAVFSFTKLVQVCARYSVQLIFTGLNGDVEKVLRQTRFIPRDDVQVFTDMDRGLEYIEDCLLSGSANVLGAMMTQVDDPNKTAIRAVSELRRNLGPHFDPQNLETLISFCETIKLEQGTALFKKGEPGDALYFIERGELSVLLRLENGQIKRLRTFGPGTVVGEMALFSKMPRSADVVTDTVCRVRKLSSDSLARLEREHPATAIQFHNFVVKLLCTRLMAANEEIRALL
jgi:SulP family sulfate permease